MEFILELILEIIIEGTFELSTSKKVILPIRIILSLILLLIYGTLIGVIAMVGIGIWQDGNVPVALMVFGIDLFIAGVIIYVVAKRYVKNYRGK
jgi:hypothetical protein